MIIFEEDLIKATRMKSDVLEKWLIEHGVGSGYGYGSGDGDGDGDGSGNIAMRERRKQPWPVE